MRPELTLRLVNANDLTLLRDVAEETFVDTFASQNEPDNIASYTSKTFSLEQVASELSNMHSEFYFMETRSGIAGYLKLNQELAQTERDLENAIEVERIYVRREHQGTGVGKALMLKAIQLARKKSADWLWLGVWDQNEKAIAFYEKAGFVEFGHHDFFLGNEKQRDLMMRLCLNDR